MQALIDQALMQALMQDNRAILIAPTPRIGESALKMSYCNTQVDSTLYRSCGSRAGVALHSH